MTLLIYTAKNENAGERLLKIIDTVISEVDVKIYRTIDALSKGLREPRADVIVVILIACSKQDLMDLLSIRDLLSDMKLILILPDRDQDTIVKGHILRPRFMSHCNSDFVDVAAVLDLMIRHLSSDKRNTDIYT